MALAAANPKAADQAIVVIWGGIFAVLLFFICLGAFLNATDKKKPPEKGSKWEYFLEHGELKPVEGMPKDPKTDPIHTNSPYYKLSYDLENARHRKYGVPYVP